MRFDAEVAETRWIEAETLEREVAAAAGTTKFCCDDLARTFAPSVFAARAFLAETVAT